LLRRTLIRWLGALGLVPWRARGAAAEARELSPTERRTLRALGRAVLPRSLGAANCDAVVEHFESWLRDYREGADRGHGSGVGRLAAAPASPAASYPAQLAVLERAAHGHGAGAT